MFFKSKSSWCVRKAYKLSVERILWLMDRAANLAANWWVRWDFPEAGIPETKSKYLGLEFIFKLSKQLKCLNLLEILNYWSKWWQIFEEIDEF